MKSNPLRLIKNMPVLAIALLGLFGLAATHGMAQTNAAEEVSGAAANNVLAENKSTPLAPIENLEAALIHSMQTEMDHASRVEYLLPVVQSSFNTERMARFIFGSEWNKIDKAEQQRFIDAFQRHSASSYADNFKKWNKEKFTTADKDNPEGSQQPGRALVKRYLHTSKGETVPFDYAVMQSPDGNWQIINVIARGVSDLALKRTQYRKLYTEGQLDAVIDYQQSEIDRLASQNQ